MPNKISDVKVNIITGFLGTGKTSAILHLLKSKPPHETWAVLVNEFGDIGLDGEIINQQLPLNHKVVIKQIAGGCMCCAANVVMRAQLNSLLKSVKPDRLLIEPSGLGHPKNILTLLSDAFYAEVLQVESVLTLIDPTHLQNERYRTHELYQQQIAVADRIIFNKLDLLKKEDSIHALAREYNLPNTNVVGTNYGQLRIEWLSKPDNSQSQLTIDQDVIKTQSNEHPSFEYLTQFYEFDRESQFDWSKITSLLDSLHFERFKAVLNTDKGIYLFNLTKNGKFEPKMLTRIGKNNEKSTIEVIATFLPVDLQLKLEACLI